MLFVEVIEALGTGKVRVDECLLLADSYLNLCRLGVILVPIEISSNLYVSATTNLLYVMLSFPFATKDTRISVVLIDRTLKILELLDPLSINTSNIWQCFLRLLASSSGSSLDDMKRIDSLSLLIKHTAKYLAQGYYHDTDGPDRTKWCQFVKIAIKAGKYSLRKVSLQAEEVFSSIVKIATALLPNDHLLMELLNLPFSGEIKTSEADILPLKGIVFSNTFAENSVGAIVRSILKPDDPISTLFMNEIPKSFFKGLLQLSNVQNALFLIFSNLKLTWSLNDLDHIAHLLSCLALSVRNQTELCILRCLMKKILLNVRLPHDRLSTPLVRFIYFAHASKAQLNNALAKKTFDDSLKILHLIPIDRDDLCFWPLACATNIVRECPQPSNCAQLFQALSNILERMNTGSDILLRLECGKAMQMSLRYLEERSLMAAVEFLPKLHVYSTVSILSLLAFLPQLSLVPITDRLVGHLLNLSALAGPLYSECLRCCENYLKFASDLSLFERDELTSLQSSLVTFLQRGDVGKCNLPLEELLSSMKLSLDRSVFTNLIQPLHLPPVSIKSDCDELEEIITRLQGYLSISLTDRNRVISKLESILSKFR